jgi:hypothetical protein
MGAQQVPNHHLLTIFGQICSNFSSKDMEERENKKLKSNTNPSLKHEKNDGAHKLLPSYTSSSKEMKIKTFPPQFCNFWIFWGASPCFLLGLQKVTRGGRKGRLHYICGAFSEAAGIPSRL